MDIWLYGYILYIYINDSYITSAKLSISDNGYFWVNYNDLTTTSLEIMVSKGNHPQMAARFRLVNYDNLPRITTLW